MRGEIRGSSLDQAGFCALFRYYSIPIGGSKSEYAVWTYEKPYEAVASIKEYLAFYPTRVDSIEVISYSP